MVKSWVGSVGIIVSTQRCRYITLASAIHVHIHPHIHTGRSCSCSRRRAAPKGGGGGGPVAFLVSRRGGRDGPDAPACGPWCLWRPPAPAGAAAVVVMRGLLGWCKREGSSIDLSIDRPRRSIDLSIDIYINPSYIHTQLTTLERTRGSSGGHAHSHPQGSTMGR